MRSSRKTFVALAAASAVFASMLVPTSAAFAVTTPISGTLLDAGSPVPDATMYIQRRADAQAAWTDQDARTTDASGHWSYPAILDGQYSFYYTLNATTVQFASNQSAGGNLNRRIALPDLTITGGVASTSTFDYTLVRNAGMLQVTMTNAVGTVLTSNATNGYGSVGMTDGVSESQGKVDLYPSMPSGAENHPLFDGTVVVPRIPAGYWTGTNVYAVDAANVGYLSSPLDGVTITAGQTTNYGSFAMVPATASAITLPSPWVPVIAGVPRVGSLLTVAAIPIAGTTVSFQWFANDVAIAGATTLSYTPSAAQLGQQISTVATLRKPGFVTHLQESMPTTRVALGDPNAATVSISGSAKLGGKLKATASSPLPSNNSFQWYRNGAPVTDADGSTYTIGKADLGTQIFVAATSTVQGHVDAVIPSAVVVIAKQAASVKATTDKTINTKATPKVKITVKPSTSKLSATAKVRVYYTKTKFKTATVKSGKSITVKLPKLKKGTTSVKVVYTGNSYYAPKTLTIKVKVSK